MGQPGCNDVEPIGNNIYNEHQAEHLGLLECKTCKLKDCIYYSNNWGFCAVTNDDKGSGYKQTDQKK